MEGPSVAVSGGARRGRRPKQELFTVVTPQEFSEQCMIPLIGICMMFLSESDQMTDREIMATSLPLSRLLLRHVSILGKWSADLVDLFAIITVMVSWQMRVQRTKRALKGGTQNEPDTGSSYARSFEPEPPVTNGHNPLVANPQFLPDPLSQALGVSGEGIE